MIQRKFNKLKFSRTYIGGSKQRENEMFADVQGTQEDNSDVNWLEYRKLFTQYSDDVLNIILSWKETAKKLSFGFLGLAVLLSFTNISLAIVLLVLSMGLQFTFMYFKHKEKKSLSTYDFSLDIILSGIRENTGFEFDKN